MQCGGCGFVNPEGMRFCGQCAQALVKKCPSCSFDNPPAFGFCGKCGASLDAPASPAPTTPPPSSTDTTAERRQITVMFCDLVGSTQLSEELDPEELRDIVRAYQTAVGEIIERYEGHVAQYLGDGILVYFGYPAAHEDDARRAVLAGIDILAVMKELDRDHSGATLQVRLGLHTGIGVVGDVGGRQKQEQLAIGQAPNVAARIQSLAEPSTLLISDDTRRILKDFFELEPLGEHRLKGVSQPMRVFRVQSQRRATGTLDMAPRSTHRFVGRRNELGILMERFHQSREGEGQGVLLLGDPGMGKSRLVRALHADLGHDSATWMTCGASPYGTGSVLQPMVELVRALFEIPKDGTPEERLEVLRDAAKQRGVTETRDVDVLASFLSIPGAHTVQMTPQEERDRTLQLLTELLLGYAAERPLILMVEDLHWVDPSTLKFLGNFLAVASKHCVLTNLTARPEVEVPWPARPFFSRVELRHLSAQEARELIATLAGPMALPDATVDEIVARADGIPLFVEELTRSVLEAAEIQSRSGASTGEVVLEIPMTLRDSLTARLDRLGDAKQIAQTAAVIGRTFEVELLAELCKMDLDTLQESLLQLEESDFVDRDDAFGVPTTYTFRHALLRDAAYDSLLKSRRREVHAEIGEFLEAQHPETAQTQPELLAQHYASAGRSAKAVGFFQAAGFLAMQRYAHAEAIGHFSKALEGLQGLPKGSARDATELQIRTLMGGSLIAVQGYAGEVIRANYERAYDLCEHADRPPEELFPVLYGLFVFNLARGHRDRSVHYARRLLEVVGDTDKADWQLSAHFSDGGAKFFSGDLAGAEAAYRRAIDHYDPAQHRFLIRYYGDDHGLFSRFYLGWILQLQGREEEAKAVQAETDAVIEALEDPLASVMGGVFISMMNYERQEPALALEANSAALATGQAHGFAFWAASALVGYGWSRAHLEGADDAIDQIRQGLGFYDLVGHRVSVNGKAVLVDALLARNRPADALDVLEEAIEICESTIAAVFAPEMYRLRGLAHAMRKDVPAALEAFDRAIDKARAFGAGQVELRASVDRASALLEAAQTEDARSALQDIATRFAGQSGQKDYRRALDLQSSLA